MVNPNVKVGVYEIMCVSPVLLLPLRGAWLSVTAYYSTSDKSLVQDMKQKEFNQSSGWMELMMGKVQRYQGLKHCIVISANDSS